MGRVSFSERVERAATKDRALAADESKWDTDHFKLGTPDGTVNLKSGILRAVKLCRYDQQDNSTVATARTEDCPRWHSFLDEATCGDAELIRFLKQFCGYSLTGSIREHALAFVHGDGGNGKSVFINIISAILKDYAVTCGMETLTATKNARHDCEIATLKGSRLAFATETEEGKGWAEARLKKLTGGERLPAQ